MDIQGTLTNIAGIILLIGVIRVVILKPRTLTELILQLFLIDLMWKMFEEMDFESDDFDWDD